MQCLKKKSIESKRKEEKKENGSRGPLFCSLLSFYTENNKSKNAQKCTHLNHFVSFLSILFSIYSFKLINIFVLCPYDFLYFSVIQCPFHHQLFYSIENTPLFCIILNSTLYSLSIKLFRMKNQTKHCEKWNSHRNMWKCQMNDIIHLKLIPVHVKDNKQTILLKYPSLFHLPQKSCNLQWSPLCFRFHC